MRRVGRLAPRLPTDPIRPLERRQSIDLTAREREVLQLLIDGMIDPQIGEELCVSRHTVRSHMRRILDKFGAATRTQAAAIAVARGLVVPEGEG